MADSLQENFQIRPGQSIAILNAPGDYMDLLGDIPSDVTISEVPVGRFDLVHLFVKNMDELNRHAPNAISALKPDCQFWISYPKQTAEVRTDITKDVGWDVVLDHKYKPVDEIEIDDIWAAKRFEHSG